LFLFPGQPASAQSETTDSVTRPLFISDSTLAITIEGPFSTIMRNRDEAEEFPATLKYSNAEGAEHQLDIQLRARGKFRRKRDICSFAPLRVNFQKKQAEGTVFAGQDKIKLVTDCQSSSSNFQQYVLKEYLAYKILNLMTDRSFSTRLLRVTYVNSDKKGNPRESYAFFIEEREHIADRLGMELVKIKKTNYSALDSAHTNFINLYEYFIGNTDYSLVLGPAESNCCHNAVLFQQGENPYISIPYDFDHAGLVDAPYAAPNPKFRIKRVTQRLYRGRCANNPQLDSSVQQFIDRRDDINRLVQELDGFEKRSIKRTMSYIDAFYKVATNPKSVQKKIVKKCS
jgi:hypothetical protein